MSNIWLNEVMVNNNVIQDEDGDYSSWLELYNDGPKPINLKGYYLTNTQATPTRWEFPSFDIPARSCGLVWLSGKDRTDFCAPLHTNFTMSGASGERYIYIDRTVKPLKILCNLVRWFRRSGRNVIRQIPDGKEWSRDDPTQGNTNCRAGIALIFD